MPETNVSLFAVLRHATLFEKLLMIIGTLSAIAAGTPLPLYQRMLILAGAALPLMTVIFGNLTNVFGGFGSPGSTTVTRVLTISDFNSQVNKLALKFVYLGIGVLGA